MRGPQARGQHALLLRLLLAPLPCAALALAGLSGSAGSAVGAPEIRRAEVAPSATPLPEWPDDGAVDHPVPSRGCRQTAPVTPGVTTRQTVTVNPATNEGYASRDYWLHLPPSYGHHLRYALSRQPAQRRHDAHGVVWFTEPGVNCIGSLTSP